MVLLKNKQKIISAAIFLSLISCSKNHENEIDMINQVNFSQQESIKLDQIAIDLETDLKDLESLGYTSNTEINQKSTWNYNDYKGYWDSDTEFSKVLNSCLKGVLNNTDQARYRFYGENSDTGKPIEIIHSNGRIYRIYGIKIIYASSDKNASNGNFDQNRSRWSGKEWYRSWSKLSDFYGYPNDQSDTVLHTFHVSRVNRDGSETTKWWTDIKRYDVNLNL